MNLELTIIAAGAAAAGVGLFVGAPSLARLTQRREFPWPIWLRAHPEALDKRKRALAAIAGGAALAVVVKGLLGAVVGAVAALVTFVALGRVLPAAAVRRREAVERAVPEVCDLLAVCLEAGLPLRNATGTVAATMPGPIGGVLGSVVAQVGLGVDEADAWAAIADEPGLAGLAREIARAATSGVPLAGVLRSQALEARREQQTRAEMKAKRVGVSSVLPLMVCFLPAFFLLGIVPIIGGIVAGLIR